MTFGNPNMIPALAAIEVLLALFLFWAWRNRRAHTARFVRPRLLASLSVGISQGRRIFRLALLGIATACILLAVARPQTIRGYYEKPDEDIDLLVAVDVSKSMLTEDVLPNRLSDAQKKINELAGRASRARLGLIAFAGEAFLQCPLSRDRDAFRQSVASLRAGMIEPGGTSLAACIQRALSAFEEHLPNPRALLIFSDFEDHEGAAVDAASLAAEAGVRIFTVGIGTPDGGNIPLRTNGNVRLLLDLEGRKVRSQLNSSLLQQIAAASGGEYFAWSGTDDAVRLLTRLTEMMEADRRQAMEKENRHRRITPLVVEHYPVPLIAGMLLLLLEMFLPERILPRRPRPKSLDPASITAGVILSLLLWASPAEASPQSALRLYRSGQYDAAFSEYARLYRQYPEDDRLAYNAGTAAYQARHYAEAVPWFEHALDASRPALNQKALYNLGNCYYRVGQTETNLPRRASHWSQALHFYEQAVRLDPQDQDAQSNRQFLAEQLARLRQQFPSPPSVSETNAPRPASLANNAKPAPSQPSPANRTNVDQSGTSNSAANSPTKSTTAPGATTAEEEALRLLEAHRAQERALPPDPRDKPVMKNPRMKDW